jgi:uncharacterized protein YggE
MIKDLVLIMKTNIKSAFLSAFFTVVLLTLIHFFFTHSWYLFSNVSPDSRFTVQGSATLTEKPDQALVSFMVNKTATKLEEAQSEANKAADAIVGDLKKMGIEEKDIKTNNYNSYPIYDQNEKSVISYRSPQTKITGYTVNQNVSVSVHDIGKINEVIDIITKDGAENISGPNYTFSEDKQKALTEQARTEAINEAKQKAKSMAKSAGIRLGRILSVQENGGLYPIRDIAVTSKAMEVSVGSEPAVPTTNLNPGESKITQTVTLSYETW